MRTKVLVNLRQEIIRSGGFDAVNLHSIQLLSGIALVRKRQYHSLPGQ